MKHDAIAVIDFGGQYAHLIATKVRRWGVLAEIRQPEDAIDEFLDFKGIIVSGSPSLASREEDSAYMALSGISGVALDITSKPPGTIEWE